MLLLIIQTVKRNSEEMFRYVSPFMKHRSVATVFHRPVLSRETVLYPGVGEFLEHLSTGKHRCGNLVFTADTNDMDNAISLLSMTAHCFDYVDVSPEKDTLHTLPELLEINDTKRIRIFTSCKMYQNYAEKLGYKTVYGKTIRHVDLVRYFY